MGRQAYMTRLALGRSAYEPPEEARSTENEQSAQVQISNGLQNTSVITCPGYIQQYDRRGHPENLDSRALLRQSRRAQNDVLATVGVCVGVDENGTAVRPEVHQKASDNNDRLKVESVMRENEVGLLLVAADIGLFFVGTLWGLGLRQRLETFRIYRGIPLTAIIKSEWKHFGPLQFLLSGITARLASMFFDVGRFLLITGVHDALSKQLRGINCSRKTFHRFELGGQVTDKLLEATTFVIMVPLEIFATLQQLDLISQWPVLPHPKALIPFTQSSPFQVPSIPANLSSKSSLTFLTSIVLSPLTLWWGLYYAKPMVRHKLHSYLHRVLPKPSNPDADSIIGAMEDELDDENIPGIGTLNSEGTMDHPPPKTMLEELKEDIQSLSNEIRDYLASWTKQTEKSAMVSNFREDLTTTSVDSLHDPSTQPPPPHDPADSNIENISRPTNEGEVESLHIQTRDLSVAATSESPPPLRTPSESSTPSPSTPNIHVSTEIIPTDSSTADILQLNVQLHIPTIPDPHHNSAADSPTVTANTPTPLDPWPTTRDDTRTLPDSEAIKAEERSRSPPYHHTTALTAYPADTLSAHLATHLTTILFLPLEALYARSVALNYLSSPMHLHGTNAAVRERLRGQVHPLGAWFGTGLSGGGAAGYIGKMVLVAGMDWAVGWAVWQLGTGVAWWAGRRWFRWGRF